METTKLILITLQCVITFYTIQLSQSGAGSRDVPGKAVSLMTEDVSAPSATSLVTSKPMENRKSTLNKYNFLKIRKVVTKLVGKDSNLSKNVTVK